MIELDIQTTADEFRRKFGALAEKQIPYAVARSLTTLANDSRNEIISAMPRVFHLRNRRSLTSIKVERTEKTTAIQNMQALVYVRDPWIAQHDEGRQKIPQRSQTIFVPVGRGTKQGARTRAASGSTPLNISPKTLMHRLHSERKVKVKPVLKSLSSGRELLLLPVQDGLIGPRRKHDSGLIALYLLISKATIKQQTLPVRAITEMMVRQRWPIYFSEFLDDAIKTAK